MDSYNWYDIITKAEFDALDVPSKEYTFFLQDIGLKTILLTKGNYYSFLYDDVFLTCDINSRNPFVFEGFGIQLKDGVFYLGVKL